jgi:predicted lipoprotein with Yx(FWY)xxD motif
MLSNDHSHAHHTQRHWLLAVPTALAGLAALCVVLAIPARSDAAPAVGPLVSTSTSSLGRILVDSRGHTLYLFQKDKSGRSTCAGDCAAAWPPLIASGKPRPGTGAKASLLGTTKRADGRMQATYNKHPLYTFVKDTKKGQTSGENVDGFGAEWYVVSPAGAKVEPKAAPASGYGN